MALFVCGTCVRVFVGSACVPLPTSTARTFGQRPASPSPRTCPDATRLGSGESPKLVPITNETLAAAAVVSAKVRYA